MGSECDSSQGELRKYENRRGLEMKTCAQCSMANTEDAAFCRGCGAPMVSSGKNDVGQLASQQDIERALRPTVPLGIVAAIVLACITGGFGWLLGRSRTADKPETQASILLASPTSTPVVIEPAHMSSAGITNTAAAPPPARSNPDIQERDVHHLLDNWLTAQNALNFKQYAAFYSSDFSGVKRTTNGQKIAFDRSKWLRDRRNMMETTRGLEVSITNRRVQLHGAWAQASFDQYFSTSKYGDWGPKIMKIRSTPGGLSIFSEELLASHPL